MNSLGAGLIGAGILMVYWGITGKNPVARFFGATVGETPATTPKTSGPIIRQSPRRGRQQI